MATPTPAPRRVRKRILIPSVLLVLFLVTLLVLIARGSWADTQIRDPKTPAEGTITQLYRTPEGHTPVRCAIVVPAPAAEVWKVITDYDNHHRFMPYVTHVGSTETADGRHRIAGLAHSQLWGDWLFDSTVKHTATDDGYKAAWDEAGDPLTVNRGSWQVRALGKNDSLVVFSLEIELANYPNFLVRNILMDRLHYVLKALRQEVARRQESQS